MSTQTMMTDARTARMLLPEADIYDMRALADVEMDALLALEEAEIQGMQISEGADFAELTELMSEDALADLDAMYEAEYWPLAS